MSIADIHKDIIITHILTRLDGQTLAATCCASSRLQYLCSDPKLWSDICSSNWPSTVHPIIIQAISNFPSGYRTFYSDAYPSPTTGRLTTTTLLPPTSHIFSSIDLRYNGELVFSKVESTNTTPSDWFKSSPFRIDLLEPKEVVPLAVQFSGDIQFLLPNLEKNMTLSWIMIDPSQNRAVNLSSIIPVSVQRNLLNGDIDVIFSVVIALDVPLHDEGYVDCNIRLTCGIKDDGELNVSGLSLMVLDMDGKCLSGKESMVILQGLTVAKRRSRRYIGGGEEQKERYDEFIQRSRERKEKMERREKRIYMASVASGVTIIMLFWSFALAY